MTDLTIATLIDAYTTDKISPYHKLRHRTRVNYEGLLRRIRKDHGGARLADLKYRTFLEWHEGFSDGGAHIPTAHGLMAMVRTLIGFGVKIIEDKECERLAGVLHGMRFAMGPARSQAITAEQVIALRAEAHRRGLPMIALAQAIQFDFTWRQKDVVGEWVPMDEPGVSEVTWSRYDEKWMRGLRWNEIDDKLTVKHITSKVQKVDEVEIADAHMVVEELELAFCEFGEPLTRGKLPKTGPVIVDPDTGRPYRIHKFRRLWRELARACGIPDDVQNRDSRAGAITEAIEAGNSIEDAQKAAKHSTTQMTARYWRGDAKAKSRTMKKRAASRLRAVAEEVA